MFNQTKTFDPVHFNYYSPVRKYFCTKILRLQTVDMPCSGFDLIDTIAKCEKNEARYKAIYIYLLQ